MHFDATSDKRLCVIFVLRLLVSNSQLYLLFCPDFGGCIPAGIISIPGTGKFVLYILIVIINTGSSSLCVEESKSTRIALPNMYVNVTVNFLAATVV